MVNKTADGRVQKADEKVIQWDPDTLHIVEIPKAVEVMQKSPVFPPEVLRGLKKWFADYVVWMRTSKNGNEEANAGNNHAVAYWLQIAVFAEGVNLTNSTTLKYAYYSNQFLNAEDSGRRFKVGARFNF